MVLFLLEFCFSFHGMLLLDSLGSRRGVIGVDVEGIVQNLMGCAGCLTGKECRSMVILPVGRVWVCLYLDVNVRRWLRIWVSRPVVGLCRVTVSFLVPCARLSPD